MAAPKSILLLASGLIVGIIAGHSTAAPDTEVIKVPVTHIKTKTKTVYRYAPLPSSCQRAADLLATTSTNSGTQSNAAGEILLALTELNRAAVATDYKAVNKAIEAVRKEKDRLDTALIEATKSQIATTSVVQDCMKETSD